MSTITSFDFFIRKFAFAILILAGSIGIANAANCLTGSGKLPTWNVNNFVANPNGLLNNNKNGGLPLSNSVVALATSEINTLNKLLGLVGVANAKQKAAIGAGIARAAVVCLKQQPEFVENLKVQIATLDDGSLLPSFRATIESMPGITPNQNAVLGGNSGTPNTYFSHNNYREKYVNVSPWRETRPRKKRWRNYRRYRGW